MNEWGRVKGEMVWVPKTRPGMLTCGFAMT
jgi:hypothetical protein